MSVDAPEIMIHHLIVAVGHLFHGRLHTGEAGVVSAHCQGEVQG